MHPLRCGHCGATIDPLALSCPYCRSTTPAGVLAHQQAAQASASRAQWDAQVQYGERLSASRRLEASATQSLVWSLLGTLLCCLPLGVVGIVMGVRARGLARGLQLSPPPRATVGIVLGIASSLGSVGTFTYAMIQSHIDQNDAAERIAEIEKRIGRGPSAVALDRTTACGLAEIYALQHGWAGHSGHTLKSFECLGKLKPVGSVMQLGDFRFKNGGTGRVELNVCFKRGANWYVTDMQRGSCSEED